MDIAGMERLLTLTQGRVGRAWLATIQHLRDENSAEAIAARRLHTDPVSGIIDAARGFAAEVHGACIAAGQAEAKWLTGELAAPAVIAKKMPVFDAADPPAVAWAQANQLDLIREIASDQRAVIQSILIDAARSGENPLVTARVVRDSIGLTEYQLGIVENYRRALENGQLSKALEYELADGRSDRALQAALRDGRLIPQDRIDAMVERYRQNAIAARAETIARTEGLRVAHQGSEEMYRQAVARGDIQADEVVRQWNAAHDPRTRSSHEAMDRQQRGMGEAFESGAGVHLAYPGDPTAPAREVCNCRCVVSTRIRRRNRPAA